MRFQSDCVVRQSRFFPGDPQAVQDFKKRDSYLVSVNDSTGFHDLRVSKEQFDKMPEGAELRVIGSVLPTRAGKPFLRVEEIGAIPARVKSA